MSTASQPYVGRGGWSWYTGAAGWLHRGAVESILGLNLQADELWFTPCLPLHWPRAELTLKRNGYRLHFVLLRCRHVDGPVRLCQTERGSAAGGQTPALARMADRQHVRRSAGLSGRRRGSAAAAHHGDVQTVRRLATQGWWPPVRSTRSQNPLVTPKQQGCSRW